MPDIAKPPSAYAISQVVGIWHRARSWLMGDEDLTHDEAQLAELLGPETEDVIEMLNRTLRAARHAELMGDMIEIQKAQLAARAKRYAARHKMMKDASHAIMSELGKKNHELPELTASIRQSPKYVQVTDEKKVEERFLRVIPERKEPDKAKLREALTKEREVVTEDGEVIIVIGEELDYACMSNGAPYLVLGAK